MVKSVMRNTVSLNSDADFPKGNLGGGGVGEMKGNEVLKFRSRTNVLLQDLRIHKHQR